CGQSFWAPVSLLSRERFHNGKRLAQGGAPAAGRIRCPPSTDPARGRSAIRHCRDWQRRACAHGEALLVGRKRPRPVPSRPPHVADLLEAYAHVALPAGIARIDSGELARDGEAFLIGRKRARAVARSRVEAEVDRQVRRADSVENDRWLLKKDFQEEFRG